MGEASMGRITAVCFLLGMMVLALVAIAPLHADNAVPSPFPYFVGDWACSGEFLSNHMPISSTVKFALDDRTGALFKHHDDNPPNVFHSVELWAAGKDNSYDDMIADSFGGVRYFRSPGWTDNAWVWSSTGEDKTIERFSYVRLDQTTMRIDWSVSKDGVSFKMGDTLTCKRS
jgi:hypothetical protein